MLPNANDLGNFESRAAERQALQNADCTTFAFGGCACPSGSCEIQTERDERKAEFHRFLARRNANTALMMIAASIPFAAVIASFLIFTVPHSNQQAKAEQENIANVVRR